MPAFLVPHKSSAHRATAIALYRALISKCRSAPATIDPPALVNIVRNTFAKHRNVTSRHILCDAFSAGYEALTHLNAATSGDTHSINHISTLLTTIRPKLKLPATKPIPAPKPQRPIPGAALAARPRPLNSLPAKRRIPVLVSANRIPFLRFSKPQPEILSRYIKGRVVQRQRRHDRKRVLEMDMEIARAEDEWDALMMRMGVRDGSRVKEVKWEVEVREALKDVVGRLEGEGERNRRVAERMVRVVDMERRLAERERKVRVMEKNEARRKRKEEEKRDAEDGRKE